MYCPQCGAQLADGVKFCGNCGFDLSAAQAGTAQQHHSTSSSAFAQAQGGAAPQPVAPAPQPIVPAPQAAPAQVAQQPAPQPEPADTYSAQYAQPQYAQTPAAGEPGAAYGQAQAPSAPYAQARTQGGSQQPYGAPGQQPYGAPQGGPQPVYNPAQAADPYPIPGLFGNVVLPKGMPAVGELFQTPNTAIIQYAESQNLGMKWHKALTYALLYLGALAFVGNAIQSFTGSAYQGYASWIYDLYPAMRVLDILNGVCYLAFAVATLYCRMLLAQFRRGAVETYFAFSVVQVGVELVYSLLSTIVLGTSVGTLIGTVFGSFVGLAVQYAIIKAYYGKRAHLFVN